MPKNHITYWEELAPPLAEHLNQQIDCAFDDVLLEAIALFAFKTERISAEATVHEDEVSKVAPLIMIGLDVLRGTLPTYRHFSAVALASMARIAVEARATFEVIAKSDDPSKYLDRYSRFAAAQHLEKDRLRVEGGGETMISPDLRSKLEPQAADWLIAKEGRYQLKRNWTLEKKLETVKQIMVAAGLEAEYRSTYGFTSAYVHCASAIGNFYSGPGGMHAIGRPGHCMRMAFFAVNHTISLLRSMCDYFGGPLGDGYMIFKVRLALAAERICEIA